MKKSSLSADLCNLCCWSMFNIVWLIFLKFLIAHVLFLLWFPCTCSIHSFLIMLFWFHCCNVSTVPQNVWNEWSQCDISPQIITKIHSGDGNRLRRVTSFLSMCGKHRSTGTSDCTHQPIISSPTRRAVSPLLLGEHAHCLFSDPIDWFLTDFFVPYFAQAHRLDQWNDITDPIVAGHLCNETCIGWSHNHTLCWYT